MPACVDALGYCCQASSVNAQIRDAQGIGLIGDDDDTLLLPIPLLGVWAMLLLRAVLGVLGARGLKAAQKNR